MTEAPKLSIDARQHAKRLEAVLTAAAETSRGLEVLQRVRSVESARGFTDELIRLGGDPGRLMFEVEAARTVTQVSALELLETAKDDAEAHPIEHLPDAEPVVTSDVLRQIQASGQTEQEIVNVLIAWASAYEDVEGMDATDTALYESLIALRDQHQR